MLPLPIAILLLVLFAVLSFGVIQEVPKHFAYGALILPSFNFAAVGDWGCNSNTKATVDSIGGRGASLVLALGDFSYQDTADCWFGTIKPIDSKTKITIGNHDDDDGSNTTLLQQYLDHFHLKTQYYSFNYNYIHFLVMSTELPYLAGTDQYNFVKNDLATASTNPQIKWIVVFFHKFIYDSPSGSGGTPLQGLRDTYHPLFDKYHVDLVLMGHNHNYQRTYPITYNSASPFNPTVTTTNTNNYKNPKGEIFETVGTGGISLFSLQPQAYYTVTQFAVFGILNIAMMNNGTTLDAKFFANDGSIKDGFTITKCSQCPRPAYHYQPYFTLSGSNYNDVASNSSLQLTQFSVASWIKTSKIYSSVACIVNKGGLGSELPGKNMNYAILMSLDNHIMGGFESSGGTDNFVTTYARTYSDDEWHYVVVTYDGFSAVKLYVDGLQVKSLTTAASPDHAGTQPVRIGANSLPTPPNDFFTGNVDEVRVWNRALSASEIATQYNNGVFDTVGQVLYKPFS